MSGSAGAQEASGAEPERLDLAAATLSARPPVRRGRAVGAVASIVAPGRVELTEVPRRSPGPGEVEVRVEGCGVCGSNIPVWEGRPWFEYPLPPGNPGHEGWGRVVRIGDGVDDIEVGQRVAYLSSTAFAEFDIATAAHAVVLPPELDRLPFPGEPLACAVNVMKRAGVRRGDRVTVVGIGFLGALVTQLATRAGAQVLAISRRASALDAARSMGAAEALAFNGEDGLVERAFARHGGAASDVVIEATGAQAGLDLASALVKERGRLVVAGYHQDGPRRVDMQSWNWRGIDVVNAHERDPLVYVQGIREAARAVADGALHVDDLLTHAFPLNQLGRALEIARTRPSGFMKALVLF